jgi:hypothetical protein
MAPKIVTFAEVEALAMRFMARGTDRLFNSQPDLHADFLLVGGLLQTWLIDGTIPSGPFLLTEPTIEDGAQSQLRKGDPP